MGSSRSAGQAENVAIPERQVAVQEVDLRLLTFQILCGKGSSASNNKRKAVEFSMRTAFAHSVLIVAPPPHGTTPAPTSSTAPSIPSSLAHIDDTTATFDIPFSLAPADGTTNVHLDLDDDEDCDGTDN
jgi:hypothetical protein